MHKEAIGGDAACAEHEIAKRVRHLAKLDPEKGEFGDIIFTSADGASPFAHPMCAIRGAMARSLVMKR